MRPNVAKIISVDWPALFCAMSVPGIWIIGFLFPFIRRGAEFGRTQMLYFALPISLIAAGFFLWRMVRVQRLFAKGAPVTGYITRVQRARDRARVEFTYEYDGKQQFSWMPAHLNADVKSLRVGQEVQIFLDPARSRRAIIAHLYLTRAMRESAGIRDLASTSPATANIERESLREKMVRTMVGPDQELVDRNRGWRVGHSGRDALYYEEFRDGMWQRIMIGGEMLCGRAHHVIYFDSPSQWQGHPEWARDRREEIIARIKSEFPEPDYEYEGVNR